MLGGIALLVLRDVKDKKQAQAFKALQREAISAGLKSDLPTTITEYRKAYSGSKQYATSDYYFEWS